MCVRSTGVKYHDARKAIGVPEGRDLPHAIDLTIYRAPAPGDPAIGQVDARGRRVGLVRAAYKWHGCIMLFAWLLCAPIAILLARYYRWTLPFAHLLLGSKLWFQVCAPSSPAAAGGSRVASQFFVWFASTNLNACLISSIAHCKLCSLC